MPVDRGAQVSVLVPLRNSTRYLRRCLQSIVDQTFTDLEIIVVDDVSEDGGGDIARELAESDPRVRVEGNSRWLGRVETYRRCLSLASGELVKFVLPQDRLRPDSVERLMAAMGSAEGIVAATSQRQLIGDLGEPLEAVRETAPLSAADRVVGGRLVGNLILKQAANLVGGLTALLFRRDALEPDRAFALGGRSFYWVAEEALVLRLLTAGSIAWVADPLCEVRMTGGLIGVPDGRCDPLMQQVEWVALAREARRVGYLADADDEGSLYTNALIQVVRFCASGDSLLQDVVPAVLTAFARAIDDLRRRVVNEPRVSVLIPPSMGTDERLFAELASATGNEIQIVSSEESGSPPRFVLPKATVAVDVVEVEPGCDDASAWSAGAEAARGAALLFPGTAPLGGEFAGSCARLIMSALAVMDDHPLTGVVRLVSKDGDRDIEGILVRASAFRSAVSFGGGTGQGGSTSQLLQSLVERIIAIGYNCSDVFGD